MINREKTIFGRGMNRRNRQSVGGEGTAPCFSSFGVGAKAWCRDGGGMGREVELRDPLARKGDGELQCLQARRKPSTFLRRIPRPRKRSNVFKWAKSSWARKLIASPTA